MHTFWRIIEAWLLICVLFVGFRCWAGGVFETGLEGWLIPFTKANDNEI